MVNPERLPVTVGAHHAYEWLATEHYLDDLLRLCPEVFLGKYVLITSLDSGPLFLTEEERAAGWESRKGIAYSPRIQDIEMLPHECWDEWYIFRDRVDLGGLAAPGSNVFEASLTPGEVYTFVNYNFGLHFPETESMARCFWKQLDWIRPETYIAETDDHLMLISADKTLFAAARQALSGLDALPEPA